MNDALQTLLRLYREPLPPGTAAAHEPAERVAALATVRDALDARPKSRPDATTLDAILAAAAHHAPVGPPDSLGQRYDRLSQPRGHARFRRAFALVLTSGVAAVAALVVLLPGGATAPALGPATSRAEAPAPLALPVPAGASETPVLAVAPAPPVKAEALPAPAPVAGAPAAQAVAERRAVQKPAAAPLAAEQTTWDAPKTAAAFADVARKTDRLATRLDTALWELPASSSLALPRGDAPQGYTQAAYTPHQ